MQAQVTSALHEGSVVDMYRDFVRRLQHGMPPPQIPQPEHMLRPLPLPSNGGV